MKRNLGINAEFSNRITSLEALDYIAAAGFDSTFTLECDTEKVRVMKERADALGLICPDFVLWKSTFSEISCFGVNSVFSFL